MRTKYGTPAKALKYFIAFLIIVLALTRRRGMAHIAPPAAPDPEPKPEETRADQIVTIIGYTTAIVILPVILFCVAIMIIQVSHLPTLYSEESVLRNAPSCQVVKFRQPCRSYANATVIQSKDHRKQASGNITLILPSGVAYKRFVDTDIKNKINAASTVQVAVVYQPNPIIGLKDKKKTYLISETGTQLSMAIICAYSLSACATGAALLAAFLVAILFKIRWLGSALAGILPVVWLIGVLVGLAFTMFAATTYYPYLHLFTIALPVLEIPVATAIARHMDKKL